MYFFFLGLAIGFCLGWLAGNKKICGKLPLPQITLLTYIAILVSLVWVLAQVISFARLTPVDPSINAIFGGIVTALFTEGYLKNLNKKD
jgi:hypothetical protein